MQPQQSRPDLAAAAAGAGAYAKTPDWDEAVSTQVADAFAQTLRKIVMRALGDGPAVDQALADGGFVMNERMVVMRLNTETDHVELFCDVGQLESFSLEANYRAALEANLCRRFPGVMLGVHPDSGRLVATIALSGLMVGDEDLCMMIVENLTHGALKIRESGLFRFED